TNSVGDSEGTGLGEGMRAGDVIDARVARVLCDLTRRGVDGRVSPVNRRREVACRQTKRQRTVWRGDRESECADEHVDIVEALAAVDGHGRARRDAAGEKGTLL